MEQVYSIKRDKIKFIVDMISENEKIYIYILQLKIWEWQPVPLVPFFNVANNASKYDINMFRC